MTNKIKQMYDIRYIGKANNYTVSGRSSEGLTDDNGSRKRLYQKVEIVIVVKSVLI